MFALTETSFYIISARRVISQAHRLLIDNWVCLPLPLSALLCTLLLHFHNHYLVIQKVRQPLLPKKECKFTEYVSFFSYNMQYQDAENEHNTE